MGLGWVGSHLLERSGWCLQSLNWWVKLEHRPSSVDLGRGGGWGGSKGKESE